MSETQLDRERAATMVCLHVFEHTRPVLLAYTEGGMLCLLCGQDDHANNADDFRIVGLGHLLADDASLLDLLDLPEGPEIERLQVGAEWKVVE